jgi:hypothetical protein
MRSPAVVCSTFEKRWMTPLLRLLVDCGPNNESNRWVRGWGRREEGGWGWGGGERGEEGREGEHPLLVARGVL